MRKRRREEEQKGAVVVAKKESEQRAKKRVCRKARPMAVATTPTGQRKKRRLKEGTATSSPHPQV